MREYLEEVLPDDTNALLENMRAIRDKMKGDFDEKVRALNEITSSWLNRPDKPKKKISDDPS